MLNYGIFLGINPYQESNVLKDIKFMETLLEFKFRTNLRGPECVVTITPYLDAVIGIRRWDVDLDNPDKILTVVVADPGHTILAEAAIEKAGYSTERMF